MVTSTSLTCAASDAPRLYDALLEAGAAPAGSLAQSAMRIEKRFLAMGHELDADTTPLEAGLDLAVPWRKPEFVGRAALLAHRAETPRQRIVTLVFDDPGAVPLGNEPVRLDGRLARETTSAGYGYRVARPLALALVASATDEDTAVEVDITGARRGARVRLGPVFDRLGTRMRG